MTVLAPNVEDILDKLVEISRGDPILVQEALGKASPRAGKPPTLEEIVAYLVKHRTKAEGEA